MPCYELCHVFADGQVLLVRALGAVFAHPFGKRLVLLVKGTQQCLILRADALVGIAHHFGRDKRLTVGKPLVVFRYLRLDIIKGVVYCHRLTALSFRPVAFGIPKFL